MASLLVVDDAAPSAQYVLLLGGDRRYDRAAELCHSGTASRVLLVERPPRRLQRLGVLPTDESAARRELASRGLDADLIEVLRTESGSDWDRARSVQAWMGDRPDGNVLVLCDRFSSRRLRSIFHAVLDNHGEARLSWNGLPNRRYDETNWWHGKEGVLHFFNSWVSLAYTTVHGEDAEEWQEWDPDDYTKALGP